MSEAVLPKEKDTDKTGRGGMALVHYVFNPDHWEFRLETGMDRGKDCAFEYITEDEWHNGIIRGQVKGTKTPNSYLLKSGEAFSYQLEKKTINYAVRSKDAFLLFLCDLVNEKVYFLPIQDYFIDNPQEYERLEKNTEHMNLRIPVENIVTRTDDARLVELTQASYSFVGGRIRRTDTTG